MVKKVLKIIGYTLGGIIVISIMAYIAVYFESEAQLNKTYIVTPTAIPIANDSLSIKSGERLFVSRGCTVCHGEDLSGKIIMEEPLIGIISGANITRGKGGIPHDFTDEDFIRSIRYGIGRDNKGLLYMPAEEYYYFNDDDIADLIAYIKSVPPTDKQMTQVVGPLMRVLFLTGEATILAAKKLDYEAPRPEKVEIGITEEYGNYLSRSCVDCHGPGLSGGRVPGTPIGFLQATNLTFDKETGIGNWTKKDFYKAMREGKRPDGSDIDPFMPWQNFQRMTDVELDAVWVYLQSKPIKSFGNQ